MNESEHDGAALPAAAIVFNAARFAALAWYFLRR
jgi:hypothetical protein